RTERKSSILWVFNIYYVITIFPCGQNSGLSQLAMVVMINPNMDSSSLGSEWSAS
ncbi:hypothetical protein BD779DRAFT_1526181, partial [Infundibulicybe gibba]